MIFVITLGIGVMGTLRLLGDTVVTFVTLVLTVGVVIVDDVFIILLIRIAIVIVTDTYIVVIITAILLFITMPLLLVLLLFPFIVVVVSDALFGVQWVDYVHCCYLIDTLLMIHYCCAVLYIVNYCYCVY